MENTLATNAATVKCSGGIVTVDGLERGAVVSIYTTDGKQLYRTVAADSTASISNLPAGILIVKAGNTASKILVK